MRSIILFAILLLFSASSTLASCDDEVRAALRTVWQSGPFHYTSQEWDAGSLRQKTGEILPYKAEHTILKAADGTRKHETISIGNKRWVNDGFGWLDQWSPRFSHQIKLPDLVVFLKQDTCLKHTGSGENGWVKYTYEQADLNSRGKAKTYKIFVDPDTSRIARFEAAEMGEHALRVVYTFRFDPMIKIEPPVVDLVKRRANSRAAFQELVENSDQRARGIVLRSLEAAQRGRSFKFDVRDESMRPFIRMHGIFVPPSSLHYRTVATGPDSHGRQSDSRPFEVIKVGDRVWFRLANGKWRKVSDNTSYRFARMDFGPHWSHLLNHETYRVGPAKCAKSRADKTGSFLECTYSVFKDLDIGTMKQGNWRMRVDQEMGLPTRFDL